MSEHSPLTPEEVPTPLQNLAHAVEHAEDYEQAVSVILRNASCELPSRWAALAFPSPHGDPWMLEIAEPSGAAPLGAELPGDSDLVIALAQADAAQLDALETAALPSADGSERIQRIRAVPVEGGPSTPCGLLVVRDPEDPPFTAAERVRIEALAMLAGRGMRQDDETVSPEVDDERSRIARDLHDLAIQELFAVGMELEALGRALRGDQAPSNTRIRSSIESSVHGLENAVAQIRQIVQSLRRERPEATLTERLLHESAMAITGLGFSPSLRLPPDLAAVESEIPEEIQEDIVAVVRECLANAARHAHASAVSVSIALLSEGVDRVVQVNVSDNGRGIDPGITRRSGLANMKSRARRHSGWVDVLNLEPGTMISWRVTLPPR